MARPAPRVNALVGGNNGIPYDAADFYSDHMAGWWPYLTSPDGALNAYRDTIVARARDVARNDGWASGTITRILDNAVGANFRPISKPDFRAIAAYSGNKRFDEKWAYEFAAALDASWRTWSRSRGWWNDVSRNLTLSQQFRLAFRHKLVDGDALGLLRWMPQRIGAGRAQYATALQILDPDRLSNPQTGFDQRFLRGGVEIDGDGVAVAYHIRRAHPNDIWTMAGDSMLWDRIERETDWGRPIIVHDYDHDQAATHRGGAGVLTPVLHRLRMLFQYDVAELDASLLNAIFSAYIESPFDEDYVRGALEGDEKLNTYQSERMEFHKEHRIKVPGSGAAMTKLFPGEKMGQVQAARPNSNFDAFEAAVLRNVASAAGVSTQQVTNNWADVNYSSHQGALQEFHKTLSRRRDDFADGFCQPVRYAFVEEAMEMDDLPFPSGAVPEFIECAEAYARAKWIGPPRGWTNPVDEVKGAVLGMDACLMDFDELCAEQGMDADEMIASRRQAIRRFEEAGIPVPTWSGMNPTGEPASKTITDPEPK